ncbi:hypothetical protein ACQPVA_19385 [Clostridium butyricum]|uniref:hypothetical protein n=1 Tax=Clostridium butyricum TaxID=1492 RepID=UPI003D34B9E7
MEMNEMIKTIEESISLFGKDELAYLSLTSKNELVIRDKIAYKLHLDLKDLVIAREYSPKGISSRIDLAVLKDDKLKDIVELKSMYTFDGVDGLEKFLDSVNKDFKKNQELVNNKMNQWGVIIATHPKQVPNKCYKDYVKYYGSIKRYINQVDKPEYLIKTMDLKIRNSFESDKYDVAHYVANVGNAFGIDVDICFWVILKIDR